MPPTQPLSALPPVTSCDSPDLDRPLLALLERTVRAGAWVLELPGRRLTWTGQLAALLELPRGAVLADALHFYAPESRELMAAALDACLQNAVPFDAEVQIITARGRRLSLRSVISGLRSSASLRKARSPLTRRIPRHIPERSRIQARLSRHLQHSFGNDVALDLVGATGDRCRRNRE